MSWNQILSIKQNEKASKNLREHAGLLLGQLNTAGGPNILRNEVDSFLSINKKFISKPKVK